MTDGPITISLNSEEFERLDTKIRADERKRCAKAMCAYCADDPGLSDFITEAELMDTDWIHKIKRGRKRTVDIYDVKYDFCDAAEIHQLGMEDT